MNCSPANDTYFLAQAGDVVTEGPQNGYDTVHSSITYALPCTNSISCCIY